MMVQRSIEQQVKNAEEFVQGVVNSVLIYYLPVNLPHLPQREIQLSRKRRNIERAPFTTPVLSREHVTLPIQLLSR